MLLFHYFYMYHIDQNHSNDQADSQKEAKHNHYTKRLYTSNKDIDVEQYYKSEKLKQKSVNYIHRQEFYRTN